MIVFKIRTAVPEIPDAPGVGVGGNGVAVGVGFGVGGNGVAVAVGVGLGVAVGVGVTLGRGVTLGGGVTVGDGVTLGGGGMVGVGVGDGGGTAATMNDAEAPNVGTPFTTASRRYVPGLRGWPLMSKGTLIVRFHVDLALRVPEVIICGAAIPSSEAQIRLFALSYTRKTKCRLASSGVAKSTTMSEFVRFASVAEAGKPVFGVGRGEDVPPAVVALDADTIGGSTI